MTKTNELEFFEKVKLISTLLPHEMPDYVIYLSKGDNRRNEFTVINDKGEEVDLNNYDEILIVGNEVVNVTCNSVVTNVKIVLSMLLDKKYYGKIGETI